MSLTTRVMRHWYQDSLTPLTALLLPLSVLFATAVKIRRKLYRTGIKKTFVADVPVIVVGNLTVGGTGKTPVVIWLAEYFRKKGFNPGIVARGVGGHEKKEPRRVFADSDVKEMGDEAVLLAGRTNCPVVIGVDRVAAVRELLSLGCDLILSDDGLQHYALGRTFEIALLDSERMLGNGRFLPAGPLRESASRLAEVNCVWVKGKDFVLKGETLHALSGREQKALQDFVGQKIHAIAGTGNPSGFFAMLRKSGLDIVEHVFPDHYIYQKNDIFFDDGLPVIMTEKDAVKCHDFADGGHWYLPVTVHAGEKMLIDMEKKSWKNFQN